MCRRRGRPAFGRPCPPEFVERVHAGAVSQRESWTRAVKASREVFCPILWRGASSSPASFSHAAAPGSARRRSTATLACTTYAVTREAVDSFLALLHISSLYGRNCLSETNRKRGSSKNCRMRCDDAVLSSKNRGNYISFASRHLKRCLL